MPSIRFSPASYVYAAALMALGLVGCELAQLDADAVPVGPGAVTTVASAGGDPLAATADDLNGSAEAEAFYYDLQYAAAEVRGPALLAHFVPGAYAEEIDLQAAREAFCADLGEGAEACHALSEQADALASEHGLDLVALGIAAVEADLYAKASDGFDFARRCPPPPEPGAAQVAVPTYYPNAYFAVESSVTNRRQSVLALQFVTCESCRGPAARLDVTLRTFGTLAKPRCPRTGCKCEPPRDTD
ncbi:MAG: hypothetical protein AAFY55_06105 [Bacteroidota bacterium]